MKEIILNSKVIGTSEGKDIDGEYRLIIFNKNGTLEIRPEQAFDGEFNEYSGLPAWPLDSFMSHEHDELYIDMGQKWGIRNLTYARKEILSIQQSGRL